MKVSIDILAMLYDDNVLNINSCSEGLTASNDQKIISSIGTLEKQNIKINANNGFFFLKKKTPKQKEPIISIK